MPTSQKDRNISCDVPYGGLDSPPKWDKGGGAAMWWWKGKKLERLYDELSAIAPLDRLYANRIDLTQTDLDGHAARQRRQSELSTEIARLTSGSLLDAKAAGFRSPVES